MKTIEVFVEADCPSCAAQIQMLNALVPQGGPAVRVVQRAGFPGEFMSRGVFITPATFVDGRLAFYGANTRETFLHQINQHTITNRRKSTMKTTWLSQAVLAGLLGTAVMTAVALMGPLIGMPEMKTGEMLAGFMGIPVAVGWIAHFMIGGALGVLYSSMFSKTLPGSPWLKGAIYGLFPWVVLQSMLSPMMGAGFFSMKTSAPLLFLLGSLMGHLVYGGIIGGMLGSRRPGTREVATAH